MKYRPTLVSFGALALVIGLMAASGLEAAESQTLILIAGHGQTAQALALGGTTARPRIVYFTGPSGRQISVSMSGGASGYTQIFTDLSSGAVFTGFVSRGCTSQNQSVTVKYNVNGTKISAAVRMDDSGASQRALNQKVLAAFQNLPKKFQTALTEFRLFCINATPCLSFSARALHAITSLKPYPVTQVINNRPGAVQEYLDKLGLSE